MTTALDAARFLVSTYIKDHREPCSEMKLHKLLYFAQREALIVGDCPLFLDEFEGWRFGPVIPSIRHHFSEICSSSGTHLDSFSEMVIIETLRRYGNKDPWSLSRLSHGEYSWKKAREGISEYQNSDRVMTLDDIRIDAQRIKERREMLSSYGI